MPLADRRPAGRPAVCIVHHNYYPQRGNVLRNAETLAHAGYDVSVIVLQQPGQPRHERLNGVDVHRLPLTHQRGSVLHYLLEYGRLLGMAFLTLTKLHLRKRFRVIEIDNMPDVLVFSAIVPKLLGAKVILLIFDNMPELFMVARKAGSSHPIVRLLAFLERISAMLADRVIVTQETAREIGRSRGVPESKLAVVLQTPDERLFAPRPRREREREDGDFEIVTHGTILERFGIQVLIDALPRIVEEIPNVRVTVFGEGEYRAVLEDHARRAGMADRIRFPGWVPLEELPAALDRFDLGYVGMLCNNMLSNKMMEYVALGLPVVAARWPTYEHYFGDDAVRFFEAGSADALARAIVDVYRDPTAARQRAHRASELFRNYAWSVQADAYRAVYAAFGDRGNGYLPPERVPAMAAAATDLGSATSSRSVL
jgi:glycosyltransferase involved in cell wall biosynthesis